MHPQARTRDPQTARDEAHGTDALAPRRRFARTDAEPSRAARRPRVALAHDYLNQRGGAERVALALAQSFPGAPLYTSLYRPGSTFDEFGAVDVRTSPLQRMPVDKHFRALLPTYPAAWRSFGEVEADVLVASSSGWAHGLRTAPDTKSIVYCHTPARWLYDEADDYLKQSRKRQALEPVFAPLRRWDRSKAAQADLYVANSELVRRRIEETYDREAVVVHPPVDLSRFMPTVGGDRWLVISRMLPYKRVDLAVEAARVAGFELDVVGTGPLLDELRAGAPAGVEFHGAVSDERLLELLHGCRGVLLPGHEDFGIVPLEAMAAGKPVVAHARGGVLETVLDGTTGVLFDEQTPQALAEAIAEADRLGPSPHVCAAHAAGFGLDAFKRRMTGLVQAVHESTSVPAPARAAELVAA